MAEPLSVQMKATMGLLLAFLVFLVAGAIGATLVGPWDVYIVLSVVVFVPVVALLLFFTWKQKRWAYAGTAVLGGFIAVASVPIGLPEAVSPLLLWETMLATVLGLLMALEGFKAYGGLKPPT